MIPANDVVLFVSSVCMYVAILWPNLSALANPTDRFAAMKAVYDKPDTLPEDFAGLTPENRFSILQVTAATNMIIAALLFGVILLQLGEWYVDRQHRAELDKRREEAIAKLDKQRGVEKKKNK